MGNLAKKSKHVHTLHWKNREALCLNISWRLLELATRDLDKSIVSQTVEGVLKESLYCRNKFNCCRLLKLKFSLMFLFTAEIMT